MKPPAPRSAARLLLEGRKLEDEARETTGRDACVATHTYQAVRKITLHAPVRLLERGVRERVFPSSHVGTEAGSVARPGVRGRARTRAILVQLQVRFFSIR